MKRTELPSIEDVSEILEMPELVGAKSGTIEHSIGLVLIFSAFVGESMEQLQIMTGLSKDVIGCIMFILQKNGVFGNGVDHRSDYFSGTHTEITLNCDIACGQNLLKRRTVKGEPSWIMTDDGISFVEDLVAKNPNAKEFMSEIVDKFKAADEAYKDNQKRKRKRKP